MYIKRGDIMDTEEFVILKLYCKDCDCILFPCPYINRVKGCTRKLSQEMKDEYIFRVEEQYPSIVNNDRLSQERITTAYNELLDWLHDNIYSAPLGKIFT